MPRLFLLRHGETEGNKKGIFRGRWDLPLNAHGRTQADLTGRALSEIEFTQVYASPLARARETAEAVIGRQRGGTIREEPALIDIDYGEWTGVADAEVATINPTEHRKWREEPETVVFPGGEGLADVRSRVARLLATLAQRPERAEDSILLVSHRVPIKVMLCVALGLTDAAFWKISLDTASLSVVDARDGNLSLVFSNETCHLKPLREKLGVVDF